MISCSLGLGKNIFLEAVGSKISNFSRMGFLPKSPQKLQPGAVNEKDYFGKTDWVRSVSR